MSDRGRSGAETSAPLRRAGGRAAGRVAIVTGGARGMGEAHVRALAAEGATVVIGDVLDAEAAALAEEFGEAATAVHLDVTDPADWRAAVEEATRLGPLSVLVNNAGVLTMEPLEEITLESWRRVLDINLTGVFLGIQAVAPAMRAAGGGAIVNISSMGGLTAVHPAWAYTASKWGVRGLTKVAALDLGRDGIRVNSIHPGMIRTAMTETVDEGAMAPSIPLGRFGDPAEVAALMLHLVFEAPYTTGAEYAIDGGILAGIRAGG